MSLCVYMFVIGGISGCKLKEGEFDPPADPSHEAIQNPADVVWSRKGASVCALKIPIVMPVNVCFVVGREKGGKGEASFEPRCNTCFRLLSRLLQGASQGVRRSEPSGWHGEAVLIAPLLKSASVCAPLLYMFSYVTAAFSRSDSRCQTSTPSELSLEAVLNPEGDVGILVDCSLVGREEGQKGKPLYETRCNTCFRLLSGAFPAALQMHL
jgi:hypothetical protein